MNDAKKKRLRSLHAPRVRPSSALALIAALGASSACHVEASAEVAPGVEAAWFDGEPHGAVSLEAPMLGA